VAYFDSANNRFEGFLNLSICKYSEKPKLCSNSSRPSYAYFTDFQNICLPLTNESQPQTEWNINYDLMVVLPEQQNRPERKQQWNIQL
jgi:hypothetical protein